jgi:predicted nucleotide-binding protein
MTNDVGRLQALRTEGESFTYENFSPKSAHGYPVALSSEWIDWTTRVESAVLELLGAESVAHRSVQRGLNVHLIGNGQDKFSQAKAHLLGSLRAAEQILSDRRSGTPKSEWPVAAAHSNRVFVVHGHDERTKTELEMLLIELGLEPIVLHRQPDEGKTVIEKFEKYSDVGYAFVLLTPDDVAYSSQDEKLSDAERRKEHRARPNVIFEFGYFVGKLGRANVCCLHSGDVVLPSDVHGLLYKRFGHSVEEIGYAIIKELKARGYQLK